MAHGALMQALYPRLTSRELGKLTADANVLGKEAPFSAKYPNLTTGLLGGGGAALGAGAGALVGMAQNGSFGVYNNRDLQTLKLGVATGSILGAISGMALSAALRSDSAAALEKVAERGKRGLTKPATKKMLKGRPSETRASVLAGLLMGQGAHQKGRLGEYSRLMGAEPPSATGSVPDIVNLSGSAAGNAVSFMEAAGAVPMGAGLGVTIPTSLYGVGTSIYDTVGGKRAQKRLQSKL